MADWFIRLWLVGTVVGWLVLVLFITACPSKYVVPLNPVKDTHAPDSALDETTPQDRDPSALDDRRSFNPDGGETVDGTIDYDDDGP